MYNTNIHHSRRHVQSKVFPIIYTEHTNPPVHMVHSLYWLRESTCQHSIQTTTKPIEKGRHLVDIKIKETKADMIVFLPAVFTASDLGGPLPRLGAVDFSSTASTGEKEVLEAVMFRLRERVNQRRVLAKPCFQDFDK